MKAKIIKDNVLVVEAETKKEAIKLDKWYEDYYYDDKAILRILTAGTCKKGSE